jgi:hypothetical protein
MIKLFKTITDKRIITIRFNEWNNKPLTRIMIQLNDNIPVIEFKKSKYYVFNGNFIEEDNQFKIPIHRICQFHISKYAFDNELLMHEELMDKIEKETNINLQINLQRINNQKITFNIINL